jgi:cytochrome P450
MSYYIIIATAGHDTTSSTIAGGLLALLQNPPEMERLRADPAILAAGGVDEMVRWVTPVKHFFRTAVEDYAARKDDQGGRASDDVLSLGQPRCRRLPDPFRFDLSRPPNRHLGFGHGPHLCLGQHLPRWKSASSSRNCWRASMRSNSRVIRPGSLPLRQRAEAFANRLQAR